MRLELAGLAIELFRIRWRLTLCNNVRPDPRIFGIDAEPFFKSGRGVRLDRVDWAFRLANTAIDAFVRIVKLRATLPPPFKARSAH